MQQKICENCLRIFNGKGDNSEVLVKRMLINSGEVDTNIHCLLIHMNEMYTNQINIKMIK